MYFYKDNGFFWNDCALFCKKKQKKPYRNKNGDSFRIGNRLRKLGYSDSNQEKQDQNLLCYHYTIAQYTLIVLTPLN